MYLYTLLWGEEPEVCEVNFASEVEVDWHNVVDVSLEKLEQSPDEIGFELDQLVLQIEKDNPALRSLVRSRNSYCDIGFVEESDVVGE